jgi:hypothetical protein
VLKLVYLRKCYPAYPVVLYLCTILPITKAHVVNKGKEIGQELLTAPSGAVNNSCLPHQSSHFV